MRPPITDAERRVLLDAKSLAKAVAAGPFRLEDRSVAGARVPSMLFAAASFAGVDFEDVEFESTRFYGTRFEDVSFRGCVLDRAVFESCKFVGCSLEGCKLDGVRFEGCEVNGLRASATEYESTSFDQCRIEDFADEEGVFTLLGLRGVDLIAPKWKDTRIGRPQFDRVSFRGGSLESVKLSEGRGQNLQLENVSVTGVDLVYGDYDELSLEGLSGSSLGLVELSARDVRFANCRLAGAGVSGGRVLGLTVEDCPRFVLWTVANASVKDLRIARSNLDGPTVRATTVVGPSVIEGCSIAAADLESSKWEELIIRDCTLDGLLHAPEAVLPRLRLSGVRYGPSYQLEDTGADYGSGARFPAKG